MSWGQFVGLGLAAGIGFTVSIFITGLAYTDDAIIDEAKIGILVASAVAAILALVVLRAAARPEAEEMDEEEEIEEVFEEVVAAQADHDD